MSEVPTTKVGKIVKHVVNFRRAMKSDERLTWNDLGHFGLAEPFSCMRPDLPRTAVVRTSGVMRRAARAHLLRTSIYAYQPFPWVKTIKPACTDTPFTTTISSAVTWRTDRRDGRRVQLNRSVRDSQRQRLFHGGTRRQDSTGQPTEPMRVRRDQFQRSTSKRTVAHKIAGRVLTRRR